MSLSILNTENLPRTLRMRRMVATPEVAMTLALLGTRLRRVGMMASAAWSNRLPSTDDRWLMMAEQSRQQTWKTSVVVIFLLIMKHRTQTETHVCTGFQAKQKAVPIPCMTKIFYYKKRNRRCGICQTFFAAWNKSILTLADIWKWHPLFSYWVAGDVMRHCSTQTSVGIKVLPQSDAGLSHHLRAKVFGRQLERCLHEPQLLQKPIKLRCTSQDQRTHLLELEKQHNN